MPSFTKNAIKQSFLKLLNQRPLSQITVKDIVEDCGVNRNSFYYHFQDIPSLLEEIIMDEADSIISSLSPSASLEEIMQTTLQLLQKNKTVVLHLYRSANRDFYEQHLMTICEYATKQYLRSKYLNTTLSDEENDLIVSFVKCELFGQMMEWLSHGMALDLTARTQGICRLFEGCIKYGLLHEELHED